MPLVLGVDSSTSACKVWLRRCEPDVFRHMASVLLPHDWLTAQLTGRRTTAIQRARPSRS